MNTQITVTMTQEEALEELHTQMAKKLHNNGDMNISVSVVVIGINDNYEEEERRDVIKKCQSMTKIQAIKYFRHVTGAGLKESKETIEDELKMEEYIKTGKF